MASVECETRLVNASMSTLSELLIVFLPSQRKNGFPRLRSGLLAERLRLFYRTRGGGSGHFSVQSQVLQCVLVALAIGPR